MKSVITTPYVFNPSAQTLDLTSIPNFSVTQLYAVLNQTRGVLMFAAGTATRGFSSCVNGILTFNIATAGMSSTDALMIIYDDGSTTNATLASMLSVLQSQKFMTVWTDDSGAFYVLQIAPGGGVNWATPLGAASSGPGTGMRPADGTSALVDTSRWQATASGTGYSVNDYLSHVVTADPSTGNVIGSFWINISTNTKLNVVPSPTGIVPISALPVGAATSALQPALNADGGSLTHIINNVSNPVPMYDAYQAPVTVTWTSANAVNTAATVTTAGYDTVIFTIAPNGTLTAGAISFEAFDGYNWIIIKAPRTDSYATDSVFTLSGSPSTHSWQLPVAGYPQVRARLSTAIVGSGSVMLVSIVSSAPDVSLVTVGIDPASTLPGFATPPAIVNSNPSAIIAGQQTSTLAAVALPTTSIVNGIVITALSNNSGTIYVGPAGVTTSTGYPLAAGASMSYGVTNLSAIYIIGTNTTDKLAYTGN